MIARVTVNASRLSAFDRPTVDVPLITVPSTVSLENGSCS